MLINVTSPRNQAGAIECNDDGSFTLKGIELSIKDMAEDLKPVTPCSSLGIVNTVNDEYQFVLRSLETVGWVVEWPEIEGDENDTEDEDEDVGEALEPETN
ncbi:hypothetical protein [Rosenbergiella collisarenosi]|uniref:hypothetical protein n=1 Tax=Rosenbergiella collisarenosi TaxID=1544695 RepID=UPI001F4EB7A3|nr:hypothetical protein [Rosenbergiella collisarenosi]